MNYSMKHRKNGKKAAAAVIAAVLLLLCSCAGLEAQTEPKQICEYDVEVLSALLGGAEGANTEARDALRICPSLLTILRFGDESEWTNELTSPIDHLMEQFYEYGYLPRDPYPGLEEGYVTSMDAPLLAVTAELAYERGLGEQYRQYMEDLIPYIVKDVSENGFILKLSDQEWWPLEYAWKSVTEEDAWFVKNGSLHGMLCIELLKNLTGDPGLKELSEKALNAHKAKADEFFYPDGSWCYYGLNQLDGGKIVNRPEKLLIEIRALKALYILTGEAFFQEELDRRSAILASILPVYIVEDGEQHTAMLLRACAPHPYMVEIYPSVLELLDENGNILATLEANNRDVNNSFIMEAVPAGAVSYRLYGKIDPVEKTLLVEQPVIHIQREDLRMDPAAGTWLCTEDSISMENGLLSIDANASERLQAYAYFTLEEPVEYGPEVYWVVELDNPTNETFPMTGVLYDQNETNMGRTLLACPPGKNLQVLHYTGFKEHPWPLDKANMLCLAFITNQLEAPQAQVQIGNVYIFRKTADVVNYLSQYEFTDYWSIAG